MASPRSLDRKAIAWHLPDALAQLSRGQPTARSLRIRDTISGIPERLGGTSRAVATWAAPSSTPPKKRTGGRDLRMRRAS
jgi:hypothetical protein